MAKKVGRGWPGLEASVFPSHPGGFPEHLGQPGQHPGIPGGFLGLGVGRGELGKDRLLRLKAISLERWG